MDRSLADEPGTAPPAPGAPAVTVAVVLSDLEPLGDRDDRTPELYYAAVRAEWSQDGFGARAELRGREGRFRPFYRGSVWLEEGYGFAGLLGGELRVGKLQRTFGLADETLGGTLFSRNGVTRNPDWGVAWARSERIGWNTLDVTASYLGRNDHVGWEEEGRGVESDPDASLRDGLAARGSYLLNQGLTTVRPGLSVETARIVRDGNGEFRRTDVGLDLTASFGPIYAFVQGLYREGEAAPTRLEYGGARALLAGLRAEFPNTVYRYVYSEWRFRGLDAGERLHQLSASWSPKRWISGTVELQARRLRTGAEARAFNAVQLGLALSF